MTHQLPAPPSKYKLIATEDLSTHTSWMGYIDQITKLSSPTNRKKLLPQQHLLIQSVSHYTHNVQMTKVWVIPLEGNRGAIGLMEIYKKIIPNILKVMLHLKGYI